jgi:hypothetical protein
LFFKGGAKIPLFSVLANIFSEKSSVLSRIFSLDEAEGYNSSQRKEYMKFDT